MANEDVKVLDLSDRGILDIEDLDLTIFEKFPNLVEISLRETEITELVTINRLLAILKSCKKL